MPIKRQMHQHKRKILYKQILSENRCIKMCIGIFVTPHMVTNSFQERGLPIWEIFMVIPIWLRGSPYGNVFYMGIFIRLPIWAQTLFWNGLVTELSPYRNGYPLWCSNPRIDTGVGLFLIPIW
jgi:hypothetical protein